MDTLRRNNLIDGEWLAGEDYLPNMNPSDTKDIEGHYAEATFPQVHLVISAARKAFPAWSRSPLMERFTLLDKIADKISERQDDLARQLAREEGKILSEARAEVMRAAQIFKFFAGECLRIRGEVVDSVRPGVDVEITREAIGVCVAITPWNFPIAIPAWKVAPALAYGNCVILKPSELAPGCAWSLARIIQDCGAPAGVFNLVMGDGASVGAKLIASDGVDAVSFTGSQTTGSMVRRICAESGKRVQLEMGGKNPLVVIDDADLDKAVSVALNGAFFSTGQRCTASSRLIVTDGIHDAFVAALTKKMVGLTVGNALDDKSEIGPVVDDRQFRKNMEALERARRDGAIVVGGEPVEIENGNLYMRPALVLGTRPDMVINQEEIFGPIASILRVRDYEEALAVANDVPFGLSAGLCTTSLAMARDFKRRIKAGMVMINLPTAGVDFHVPFGGVKESSYGPREQGSYAKDFYTVMKTTYIG
ncbi:aldehyde dehydrogenase family protein [Govanella unica]|uniref:Aldehyde dehydrogenase family protein n=1 Tax=Govanella unica TaxID=2975056 RepID=A0A9X3Z7D4_9PROT|nr:aldehyde dehydrogenase family protein [Govania unica]MDA5193864.1 aldehyde dehydrogenase family protein [Govania unica]